MNTFLRVVLMEWRKQRGSLAIWIILAGACFTPTCVLLVRLLQRHSLPRLYATPDFWHGYWNSAWESMAVFLLPVCTILVTALLAQIEHRNNTWKQVSVLPVAGTTVYLAKLLVAAFLMALFLLVFVISATVGALLPAWLFADVRWPPGVSFTAPLQDAARHYLFALPILGAQFALSLRFANVVVPVGAGFLAWVAALALLSWPYAFAVPYGQGIQYYMAQQPGTKLTVDAALLGTGAAILFVLFTVAGMLGFATRKVKG